MSQIRIFFFHILIIFNAFFFRQIMSSYAFNTFVVLKSKITPLFVESTDYTDQTDVLCNYKHRIHLWNLYLFNLFMR